MTRPSRASMGSDSRARSRGFSRSNFVMGIVVFVEYSAARVVLPH